MVTRNTSAPQDSQQLSENFFSLQGNPFTPVQTSSQMETGGSQPILGNRPQGGGRSDGNPPPGGDASISCTASESMTDIESGASKKRPPSPSYASVLGSNQVRKTWDERTGVVPTTDIDSTAQKLLETNYNRTLIVMLTEKATVETVANDISAKLAKDPKECLLGVERDTRARNIYKYIITLKSEADYKTLITNGCRMDGLIRFPKPIKPRPPPRRRAFVPNFPIWSTAAHLKRAMEETGVKVLEIYPRTSIKSQIRIGGWVVWCEPGQVYPPHITSLKEQYNVIWKKKDTDTDNQPPSITTGQGQPPRGPGPSQPFQFGDTGGDPSFFDKFIKPTSTSITSKTSTDQPTRISTTTAPTFTFAQPTLPTTSVVHPPASPTNTKKKKKQPKKKDQKIQPTTTIEPSFPDPPRLQRTFRPIQMQWKQQTTSSNTSDHTTDLNVNQILFYGFGKGCQEHEIDDWARVLPDVIPYEWQVTRNRKAPYVTLTFRDWIHKILMLEELTLGNNQWKTSEKNGMPQHIRARIVEGDPEALDIRILKTEVLEQMDKERRERAEKINDIIIKADKSTVPSTDAVNDNDVDFNAPPPPPSPLVGHPPPLPIEDPPNQQPPPPPGTADAPDVPDTSDETDTTENLIIDEGPEEGEITTSNNGDEDKGETYIDTNIQ